MYLPVKYFLLTRTFSPLVLCFVCVVHVLSRFCCLLFQLILSPPFNTSTFLFAHLTVLHQMNHWIIYRPFLAKSNFFFFNFKFLNSCCSVCMQNHVHFCIVLFSFHYLIIGLTFACFILHNFTVFWLFVALCFCIIAHFVHFPCCY